MLINRRGRGFVGFLVIFGAVALLLAGAAVNDGFAMLGFSLGWTAGGVVCLILGRRWNRVVDIHRFCTLRLQTWGYIYIAIGLTLLNPAISELRAAMTGHY